MSQQTMDCSEARLSLGVYVLGAIDPAERAQVDSHLATCRDCRDELAGLAGLPALLARVGTEEAIALAADEPAPLGLLPDAVKAGLPDTLAASSERTAASGAAEEPPRELLGTVLDLTAARRRRRNWRNITLAAAAAVVLAGGAFGGARLASGTAPPSDQALNLNYGPGGNWQTVAGSTQGMEATVKYRQVGWGTQLAAEVVGIPVDTTCQLWVVGPGGSKELAGSWTTDSNEGSVWYSAGTSTPQPDVHGFVVTVDGHQPITVP